MTTAAPAVDGVVARSGQAAPASLPWRGVALSAMFSLGVAALILPAVAAHTGGWVLRNDGAAYFLYARALVLEGTTDPTMGYRELDARLPPDPLGPLAALRESARRVPATGRIALPWPVGAGLLMAPFYAAGWGAEVLAAERQGRKPDSFGLLPQLGYGLGAVAYGLLGFWASWLGAVRLAGRAPAAAAVLAVVLGGPAVFYIFFHPTMAHAASLGLAAALVLLWWRLWDAGKASLAALAGLSALLGLMILVRYQNVVFGLLPAVLWARLAGRRAWDGAAAAAAAAVLSVGAFAAPLAVEAAHRARSGEVHGTVPMAGAAAMAPAAQGARPPTPAPAPAPPDGTAAEPAPSESAPLELAQNRFDLASPHFFDVLLSCQHGAFYWTPVLGLGTAALAWQALRRGWARAFIAVLLASVYLAGCLVGRTNWSGDNSFGMRYLSESAPLLAPALAVWIGQAARPAARWSWALALAALILANGLLILAFARRTIPHRFCVTYRQMAVGIARALPGGWR